MFPGSGNTGAAEGDLTPFHRGRQWKEERQ